MSRIFFKFTYFFWINFFLFFFNYCYSEVPIIIISPSKTAQSLSTVGSDLTILNKENLFGFNEYFLDNILDYELNGSNISRQGGTGTNSLIQLRGYPKRYTNIYIDGVKLSDPSTPDNAFYLNNLTSSSIKSVEILKGNHSSVYGSSAIGGVLNIYSKDGREKDNKSINLGAGSHNSKNIIFNYGENRELYNYTISLEKYLTNGISAMSDNSENDKYQNDNLHAAFGINAMQNLRIESNLRYYDTFLNYDEVAKDRIDKNSTKDESYISNIKLINKNKNLNNSLIFNHYYSKRKVTNYNESIKNFYYGERKNINYLGEYSLSLDKKIVFGLDNEFNRANFDTWATSGNKLSNDKINSQYLDYQQRLSDKFYTTIGIRNDIHSQAGAYKTGRITNAYNFDKLTKFRSSFGTGIRFGSLNDYYYDINLRDKKKLAPEKSYSIDFGLEKEIDHLNMKFNSTFFYSEYKDNISNWASNTDNGTSSYVIENSGGKIKSKGLEIGIEKRFNKKISTLLNYTFIEAYDGEDCDDPDRSSSSCSFSSYPVRVPKHAISAQFKSEFSNFFNSSIKTKYISSRRDYGNVNNNFQDVKLNSYFKIDLKNQFIFDNKIIYFDINNLFDKNYEDSFQYNSEKRNIKLGIKKIL